MDPVQALGWTGQALFMSRVLLQWIASERARRPVVPRLYWQISFLGSVFVTIYTLLEKDLVYTVSVLPGGFVALRNLMLASPATRRQLAPYAAVLLACVVWTGFLKLPDEDFALAAIGFAGAVLWSGRHVVQWWVSERLGRSVLPTTYWILSLVGGTLLLSYALWDQNLVMIVGYGTGMIPYARNLVLGAEKRK